MITKSIGALFIIWIIAFSSHACAEIKIYEGIGEYVMSDFETPDVARQRAKLRAEQSCVEQAGIFIQSYTKTVNSIATNDEIIAIANNVINIIDDKYVFKPSSESSGSFIVQATIHASIDSKNVETVLNSGQEKIIELTEKNKILQKEVEEKEQEILELRKKLAYSHSEMEKEELKLKIEKSNNELMSELKYNEGWKLAYKHDTIGAILSFTKAIDYNPNNAAAYSARSSMWGYEKNYEKVLHDRSMVIKLKPYDVSSYTSRALLYKAKKQYGLAIQDYDYAISLAPNDAKLYKLRGDIYALKGDIAKAIDDYTIAIKLKPSSSLYEKRGHAYLILGQNEAAENDFKEAELLR